MKNTLNDIQDSKFCLHSTCVHIRHCVAVVGHAKQMHISIYYKTSKKPHNNVASCTGWIRHC